MRTHIAHRHFPAIPLALLVLSLSFSPAVSAAPEWKTYRDAAAAFESGDASVRAEAFAWARARLGGWSQWDITQAFRVFCAMAESEAPDMDFTALYREIAPGHPDEWCAALAGAIAENYARRNEAEKAQAFLGDFLAEKPAVAPEVCADIVVRRANWLADTLGRPQVADGILVAGRDSLPKDASAALARIDVARAAILADYLAQADQAETLWRDVLSLGPSAHERDFSSATDRLSAMLRDKGDKEGATVVLLGLLDHPSLPPAWFADRLLSLGTAPEARVKAIDALRRRMAQVPASEQAYRITAERIQPQVVALLLALGRTDEALAECRVTLQLASERGYESAVGTAAKALKCADANLGRANVLLAFASAPEPSPSVPNPLLTVPEAADPVRTAFAERLSSLPDSPDWHDHLSRSLSWLWLDRPADAMRAAVRAFSLCPLETNALQQCAAAATRPFLIATRDEAAVQPLLEFLLLGSDGPDGQAGTADDLPDPFPALTARMEPSDKTAETP